MSKKVTDLPLASTVEDADLIMIVQDSDGLSKKAPNSLIGGAPGAGGKLVWQLDPSGVTQFTSAGAADVAVGGGGGSWATASIAERGDVLVYTPAGGTTVTELFMFNTALPFTGTRRDMVIDVELYDSTFGSGYFGPFFYADAAPLHGFAHCGQGLAEWQTIYNNGAVERSAGTGNQGNTFVRYHIRGRKPASAPPELTSYMSGWDPLAGTAGEPRRSGSTAAARGGVSEFGNASTLGASWNALNCDRFGLAVLSSGGNPPPTQIRLMDMRVYLL